ncbi:MAG: DUF4080 domain-containing protein [Gallionella sp.]|nr:DUF4080 domain-containing protein [Gallionella sp.]
MTSFAQGFDRLVALRQQEIQVGVLKRLRGTNIIRHTEKYGMRYTPYAPYTVLATDRIDFTTMQRLVRFARYWDLVANSGRFPQALPLLLGDSPFAHFMTLSDWFYATTRKTHQIALDQLFELVYRGMIECLSVPQTEALIAVESDFILSGSKAVPAFLKAGKPEEYGTRKTRQVSQTSRQDRHLVKEA